MARPKYAFRCQWAEVGAQARIDSSGAGTDDFTSQRRTTRPDIVAYAPIIDAPIGGIVFVARVSLRSSPEGHRHLVDRLTEEATVVPDKSEGGEFYVVSIDTNDDHHVLIAEEWTDRASFDAYQQSDYFATTLETLKSCLAASPNSAYYESTRVGP